MRIEYSKLSSLNVKYNNDKSRDYTNPTLPTGDHNLDAFAMTGKLDRFPHTVLNFNPIFFFSTTITMITLSAALFWILFFYFLILLIYLVGSHTNNLGFLIFVVLLSMFVWHIKLIRGVIGGLLKTNGSPKWSNHTHHAFNSPICSWLTSSFLIQFSILSHSNEPNYRTMFLKRSPPLVNVFWFILPVQILISNQFVWFRTVLRSFLGDLSISPISILIRLWLRMVLEIGTTSGCDI